LNKIVAILTFIGIFLQTFSTLVIVADYCANKDYIAKNLCENRDKPKMHCNGKCYLAKKLLKESKEQGSKSPNDKKERQIVDLFFVQASLPTTLFASAIVKDKSGRYMAFMPVPVHPSIFHPPTA
jgi:hypothetical protein